MTRVASTKPVAGPEQSGPATGARPPKQEGAWRKRAELTVLLVPPLVLFIGFVLVPIVFAA